MVLHYYIIMLLDCYIIILYDHIVLISYYYIIMFLHMYIIILFYYYITTFSSSDIIIFIDISKSSFVLQSTSISMMGSSWAVFCAGNSGKRLFQVFNTIDFHWAQGPRGHWTLMPIDILCDSLKMYFLVWGQSGSVLFGSPWIHQLNCIELHVFEHTLSDNVVRSYNCRLNYILNCLLHFLSAPIVMPIVVPLVLLIVLPFFARSQSKAFAQGCQGAYRVPRRRRYRGDGLTGRPVRRSEAAKPTGNRQ